MHREIVALYRRAYGIIISPGVSPRLPPSIALVARKGVARALGPASNPTRPLRSSYSLVASAPYVPRVILSRPPPFSITGDLLAPA